MSSTNAGTSRLLVRCGDHPQHDAVFLYGGGMCQIPGPGAVIDILFQTGVAVGVGDGVWNAPHDTVQGMINQGWLGGPIPAGYQAPPARLA